MGLSHIRLNQLGFGVAVVLWNRFVFSRKVVRKRVVRAWPEKLVGWVKSGREALRKDLVADMVAIGGDRRRLGEGGWLCGIEV
jgi:hypothetical protein